MEPDDQRTYTPLATKEESRDTSEDKSGLLGRELALGAGDSSSEYPGDSKDVPTEEDDLSARPSRRTVTQAPESGLAYIDYGEDQEEEVFFIMGHADAVENLGISAYCLFETHGANLLVLICVAFQGFFLQYTILYFMFSMLKEYEGGEDNVSPVIVVVAVYLHVVSTVSGLPFGITTLVHFPSLKDSWMELLVSLPIFLTDCLVTPTCTLTVGSLYLCTSGSVGEVILNSCAVAFIDNIDNWILSLNQTMNRMGGINNPSSVYLPYHRTTMKVFNYLLCITPVLPVGFSCLVTYVGLVQLHLGPQEDLWA